MKKVFIITALTFISTIYLMQQVIAQAPDKMSYQAVIRDANSTLVTNSNIGMQVSILKGSATGQDVYIERHFPTTNTNGLVTLEIGSGVVVSGDFGSIDWSDGPFYIKSETDLNGGANYTIEGTSQILSVPYSLHAKYADSVPNFSPQTNAIMDADGDTKIQVEATSDEDSIRFDIDGLQYFGMGRGQLSVLNSGRSIFLGESAGSNDDLSDNDNIAIGYLSLHSNILGIYNNAVGNKTLYFNLGDYNNAFGNHALEFNTTGYKNTAMGRQALRYNTVGFHNTANGNFALRGNTSGFNNTAVGAGALYWNVTGNENTSIGFSAGVGVDSLNNVTAIGARAQVDQDNSIVLGSINGVRGATSDVNVGIGTSAPDQSAILELNSDSRGFLLPRMNSAQRDAINNPTEGLMIFNSTLDRLNIYIAGSWHEISLGSSSPNPTAWDTVYNPITGRYWMDRNLGAVQVATGHGDVLAYGDLYQWGRFSDGHEFRTSETTPTLANTSEPNQGNSWDGLFISTSTFPYDWLSSQADSLWQGVNGFNNPCPEGFRIPTEKEWEAERQSWISNDKYGAYNSPLKLPAAGYRSREIGTLWYNNGSYACSTIFGTDTYRLWFESTDAYMQNNSNRASGISVRCIMDE